MKYRRTVGTGGIYARHLFFGTEETSPHSLSIPSSTSMFVRRKLPGSEINKSYFPFFTCPILGNEVSATSARRRTVEKSTFVPLILVKIELATAE